MGKIREQTPGGRIGAGFMQRMGQAALNNGGRNFKMMADGGKVDAEKARPKQPAEKVVEKADGMFGKAGREIMNRKAKLDEAEEKAVRPAKYADGGMVKKAHAGHGKIAAAHRDKPFHAK